MNQVTQRVTDFYLGSRDFNGIPLAALAEDLDMCGHELKSILRSEVQAGELTLVLPWPHPNPHIKALPSLPIGAQLEGLDRFDSHSVCVYPSPQVLRRLVDQTSYTGRPFTLALALGRHQLAYESFDLSVLKLYHDDPRYVCACDDVSGHISISDDYFQSGAVKTSDEIVLESFGFSFDGNMNKYLAAFLRDLRRLSPEHQGLWDAKKVLRRCRLDPEYRRMAMGEWRNSVPIIDVILEEMHHINELTRLVRGQVLFRDDYSCEGRPKGLCMLLLPTLKCFNDFVLLLDKVVSQNISQKFFAGRVAAEKEERRGHGKIAVSRKGTLQMLGEWLELEFPLIGEKRIREIVSGLKRVRSERRNPAHEVQEDQFDQSFCRTQRELLVDLYSSLHLMRRTLSGHPRGKEYSVPDDFERSAIRIV